MHMKRTLAAAAVAFSAATLSLTTTGAAANAETTRFVAAEPHIQEAVTVIVDTGREDASFAYRINYSREYRDADGNAVSQKSTAVWNPTTGALRYTSRRGQVVCARFNRCFSKTFDAAKWDRVTRVFPHLTHAGLLDDDGSAWALVGDGEELTTERGSSLTITGAQTQVSVFREGAVPYRLDISTTPAYQSRTTYSLELIRAPRIKPIKHGKVNRSPALSEFALPL